ncbi:MAG: hypothetical protein V7765_09980 [Oleispira sp.]
MKKILILTTVAILISGCGGGAPNKVQSDLDKKPTPPPETTPPPADENRAPTIAGTPTSSLLTNTDYLFTPVAADADNDVLTFSIINKPSWAEFDTSTGELKGQASTAALFENIIISVADKVDTVNLDKFSILVTENNLPPVIYNQTLETMESTELMITLGPENDIDGDYINYSVTDSMNTEQGNQTNQIIYNSASIGVETLQVTASDNNNDDVTATINITTSASSPSNYITSRDIITPDYGSEPPAKGESRIDPTSGTRITRLTDASELAGTDDALIVYSRYTPENTSGKYFLAFGSESNQSWIIERITGDVIIQLTDAHPRTIGEFHEVRWDTSGNHPNRLYYRKDLTFNQLDLEFDNAENVTLQHTLLKDFSALLPNSSMIYNDVEGDSSNDSDHWAFMAIHYGLHDKENDEQFLVDAFVHYQVSTGDTHIMKPGDLAGTELDMEKDRSYFSFRPNMVEVSPLGTGIVIHMGRKWDNSGSLTPYVDTWFDGPHLWPLDFKHSDKTPIKISVGETHSGWSLGEDGREIFVSQNNRTDQLDAVYATGSNAGYTDRIEIGEHEDFGWSNGFHYGKMPVNKPGWTFVNTYSEVESPSHSSAWAANQLFMMQIKHKSETPKIWRISPNYNAFSGSYRDEAPAAINTFGNRVYVSNNWGGQLSNREVFVFELPSNWDSVLKD